MKGAEPERTRVSARLRDMALENDPLSTRPAVEKSYRRGWNAALKELERWLDNEGKRTP